MIIEERLEKLDSITLHRGSGGMEEPCLMNVVDYISGGDGSIDHPDCASRVITTFVIGINDAAVFAPYRDELMQYAARIVGTAGTPYQEQTRAYMLADWAVRTIAPMALLRADQKAAAEKLRALKPIFDEETARNAYYAARGLYRLYRNTTLTAAEAAADNAEAAAAANAAADAASARAKESAEIHQHAASAYAVDAVCNAGRYIVSDRKALMDLSLEMLDNLIKVTE